MPPSGQISAKCDPLVWPVTVSPLWVNLCHSELQRNVPKPFLHLFQMWAVEQNIICTKRTQKHFKLLTVDGWIWLYSVTPQSISHTCVHMQWRHLICPGVSDSCADQSDDRGWQVTGDDLLRTPRIMVNSAQGYSTTLPSSYYWSVTLNECVCITVRHVVRLSVLT